MFEPKARAVYLHELEDIESQGLTKSERLIDGPQSAHVDVQGAGSLLNLCANNYLGLANHPALIDAAKDALDRWGYGLSSVRFICGSQVQHKQLEHGLSEFLGMEDTILYSSCFDANAGLFETLLGPEDAVLSDALNHASIIDGVRLCKARRFRYAHSDMADLQAKLEEAADARIRLIATDGVFSMDGEYADLKTICDLADKHCALVMVDDSHAVGFVGQAGRGTHERADVMERVDLLTGTLGKALGGASGGYTSGRKELVALLRQRSRPYLFSNALAPAITAASLRALELIAESGELRDQLDENTAFFRAGLRKIGFNVPEGEHPIVPIMLGDAKLAVDLAERLLVKGVYVIAFSYPVVPKGQARIRTQLSAAHTRADLEYALEQFADAWTEAN